MKKTTRFFTVLLVVCFCFGTHAQELVKPYENMLEYVNTQKGKAENFQKFQVFKPGTSTARSNYSTAVDDGVIIEFDARGVSRLLESDPRGIQLEIPIKSNGQTVQLDLVEEKIFSDDFRVRTSDGRDITNTMDRGKHFRGVIAGDSKSLVSLSIFKNEIIGFIANSEGNFVVGKLADSQTRHIIYNDADMLEDFYLNCEMPDDGVSYTTEQLTYQNTSRDPGDCVNIYVEAGQSVYNSFGGNLTNTTNFLNGVFAQSYALYANEGINMQTSDMFIWTTPDPYTGGTTGDQLTAFQNNTGAFNGDLGHLVEVQNIGGLAAGFSGICNANTDNSLCFSGFSGNNYNNVPTYSFNVFIITHEMGHLLGSRHTHACVWNGNNTAIDGCSGFTEGTCALPPSPPGGGTIMSYCHNDPVGVDFNQGFHPQPSAVINNTVNAIGNCLVACGAPGNDDCAGAIPINYGDTVSGTTIGATADSAPFCGTSTQAGVWYTFTGQDAFTRLSTCDQANYDTKISVYTGSCGGLVCVTGQDDNPDCLDFTTEIDFCTEAGETYYVIVHGWSGATGNFDLTLTDVSAPPTAVCAPPFTVQLDANGEASITVADIDDGSTSQCGIDTMTIDQSDFTCADLGDNTITLTVTDVNGNSSTCTTTVTVEDNISPVISCTTDKLVDTDPGMCTYMHLGSFWDPSYTDNCPTTLSYELTGATTGTGSSLNGVTFNLGETTVTWTATDVGGNTDVCSYTVTVEDNEAPEVTCIMEATVETDADVCNYTHSGTSWDATATDNCSLSTLSYVLSGATTGSGTSLDGVTFNLGTTTVTWTATDAIGNSQSCSTTITVEDTEAPVIICISSKLRDTDPGECTYTHSGTLWDSLASDNCNVASLTYELSGATTGTGTSLDGVTFNLGTTTVVWTTIDDAGNSDVCTYTVTIEDNEAPVISCTANQSVDTDTDVCTYTHSGTAWDATATDNCGVAAVEYTLSGATTGIGSTLDAVTFNLGTTTVTWTATDNNGNTDVCTFEITVEDNQSPEISCGGNQTVDADAGSCSYTHSGTGWNATATDNCGVTTITYSLSGATTGTGSSLSGVTFNLGTTTVTWTATDAAGNTDVCSFTVTVEDNESPQAVCQDLTIQLDANGQASILVEDLNGGSTDNCGAGGLTYTASKTEFDCGDVGVNTVIFTVTDAAGNTSSCTATVTVEDLIAPEALCVTDFTLELDENGEATLTAAMLDGGSMDNCEIADISISQTAFDCSDIGENTVTFTVTDSEGNSTSCTSVVTVADSIPPVISCPGDLTVDPNANGTYVVEDFLDQVTATDNCTDPVVNITQEPAPNTMLSAGTYTITFTAEDEAGNTSSCSFELEVTPILGTDTFNLNSLTMYPNPAATAVNIGNPGMIAVDQISIYDIRGRMVVQQQYNSPQDTYSLDVSKLSSSVYIVMIQGEGAQTAKRLIKK